MNRKIMIASHGELSEGIADTARMILGGISTELISYCLKPGLSADAFAGEVLDQLVKEPETEFVILTDLYGASVCTAMTSLLRQPGVRLFTGMNINMLLSLCVEYPNRLSDDDCMKIIHDARAGIQYLPASGFEAEAEDF